MLSGNIRYFPSIAGKFLGNKPTARFCVLSAAVLQRASTPLRAAELRVRIANSLHADLFPIGSNGNSAAIKASTPYNAAHVQIGIELSRDVLASQRGQHGHL